MLTSILPAAGAATALSLLDTSSSKTSLSKSFEERAEAAAEAVQMLLL